MVDHTVLLDPGERLCPGEDLPQLCHTFRAFFLVLLPLGLFLIE